MALTAPTQKQIAAIGGFDYTIKAAKPLKDFCDGVVSSIGSIPNFGAPVADTTALKAVSAANRTNGQVRVVEDNGSGKPTAYQFASASAAAESLPKIVQPASGTGRWLALADDELDLSLIPVAGEKAALAGTTGTPSALNKYVTDTDTRLLAATNLAKIKFYQVTSGGGSPAISVANATSGFQDSKPIFATVQGLSNAVYLKKVSCSGGNLDVLFSGDPGANTVVNCWQDQR